MIKIDQKFLPNSSNTIYTTVGGCSYRQSFFKFYDCKEKDENQKSRASVTLEEERLLTERILKDLFKYSDRICRGNSASSHFLNKLI